MENRLNKLKIVNWLILIFFSAIFLFVRSFMGIYLFNYRIGELAVLFCFLLTGFYVLFLYRKNFLGKPTDINYLLIVISFLLTLIISGSNIFDTYTYKSSSYIWTMSFIFVGIYIYKNIDFDDVVLKVFLSLMPLIYLFLVLLPPNIKKFFGNFFGMFSDKYEMHKGSDLLIIYVIVFMISNTKINKGNFYIYYFIFISSLFFPLLMFKSRGAFIGAGLFFIVEVFRNRKVVFNGIRRTVSVILLFILILNLSVFFISGSSTLEKDDSIIGLTSIAELRYKTYVEYDEGFSILFFRNNRIYSADGNLNWRLQIWQDVWEDIKKSNNTLFFGFGYKEKIPAMNEVHRQGLDFKNENVHNNFVNILARGGLLQLLLFISFYYFLISKYKEKFGNYDILIYILPILFCSFFDASMENSHFPLLYYFFLGRLFIKEY